MNFLKSVFAEEPDPPTPESESESKSESSPPGQAHPDPNPPLHQTKIDAGGDGGMWSFGGLFKTLTTKSESVVDTYRRDLKEFGSGLRKEIEVAQGSLGSMGHTIDEIGSSVLKGTAQIISQGKEAILALDNPETDYNSSDNNSNSNYDRGMSGLSSKRYSRFDAVIRGVQGDPNTYVEEPEDKEEYEKWKMGFGLGEKRQEMGKLLEENEEMRSVYGRLVPGVVEEEEEFWFRYYYKVFKVRQAEDVRADIVRRAISMDEEEELSWDVEDEKGEERVEEVVGEERKSGVEGNVELGQGASVEMGSVMNRDEGEKKGGTENEGNVDVKVVKEEEENLVEGSKFEKVSGESVSGEEVKGVEKSEGGDVTEGNEKVVMSVASNDGGSSDVLRHPPVQEEDLEWDEIEDLSSIDEKKVGHSMSPNKVDLRKRLSAAEEEDLSWDIEDDDDEMPVKA